MGDVNPIRTLKYYPRPSHEGYRNTIELSEGNNVVPLRSDTIRLVKNGCSFHGLRSEDPNQHLKDFLKFVESLDLDYCMENLVQAFVDYASLHTNEAGGKWYTFKPEQNNLGDTYNPSWKSHPNLRWRQPQNSQNNFSNPPNRFQPNGSFPNRSFNNNPQSFNNQSNLEGLVSNFMASQDARLSKFEADFKQQQSEMTNKIDTVLKAITDRITGALPSNTVKNPKLNVNSTSPVLSARSYPTVDPRSTLSRYVPNDRTNLKLASQKKKSKMKRTTQKTSIPTIPHHLIHQFHSSSKKYANSIHSSNRSAWSPSHPTQNLFARKGMTVTSELAYHKYLMYRTIPSIFLRNPIITEGCPSNLKIPCNIEHVHVEKAYIDLNSPLNVMTRMLYNWIMRRKLDPRENPSGGVNNFTGRIKGMHVFVGNFTYVTNFLIAMDISSIIDPRLSQVVLGRPFVETSNMTHNPPEGVVRFTNVTDEIAYKMPRKIEQYNSLSDLEKEHTKLVYLRSEEDKRREVEYVMSKIVGFYKECLELGPEYVIGIADEGEVTIPPGQGDQTIVHEDKASCIAQLKDDYIKGDRTKHILRCKDRPSEETFGASIVPMEKHLGKPLMRVSSPQGRYLQQMFPHKDDPCTLVTFGTKYAIWPNLKDDLCNLLHILPKFFFTHDLYKSGDKIVQKVHSSDNLTYLFTKALPTATFKKLVQQHWNAKTQ
ncbi:hypothetical protein Tco_0545587 [Tanacetum coccineum]